MYAINQKKVQREIINNMFKKIITIVLPIIAVTAAIFVFGLKVYQDSFDKFQYDGVHYGLL